MRYYLVQHGKALSSDVDESRPLSDDGENETHAIAETLKKNKIHISRICHSGKRRAAQTAEIIASALGIDSIHEIDGMKPGDDVAPFTDAMLSTDSTGDSMFVGHLPHMQKLASYLLTGDETSDSVIFQNSAVLCVEINSGTTNILWYMTPSSI